jgi:hypothetical protein
VLFFRSELENEKIKGHTGIILTLFFQLLGGLTRQGRFITHKQLFYSSAVRAMELHYNEGKQWQHSVAPCVLSANLNFVDFNLFL